MLTYIMGGTEQGLISKAISTLSALVRVLLWTVLSLISLLFSILLSQYWSDVSGILLLILGGVTVLIGFCSLYMLYIEPLVLWLKYQISAKQP